MSNPVVCSRYFTSDPHMNLSYQITKKYTPFIVGALVLSFFFGSVSLVSAAWAPAGTTPPNEPTGSTPQQKYYHPIVTTPAGPQEKVGKLGVGAAPATEYDFNVEGIGSFLGGVWASAGVFLNNVCIGTPIIATQFCPSGNNSSTLNIFGTFQSKGTNANIQNDKLRHTSTLANGQPALERVCSTDAGILRLCDPTAAGVQGGGGVVPVGPGSGTVGGTVGPTTPTSGTGGTTGGGGGTLQIGG